MSEDIDKAAAQTYVSELLELYARIEKIRNSSLIAQVGYRSIMTDLTTLDHITQKLDDYNTNAPQVVQEIVTHLVENREQPCVSGGDNYVWEWEHDQVLEYLTANFARYVDELYEMKGDDQ